MITLDLSGGDQALVSTVIHTPGRRTCGSVMVIAADAVRVDEQIVTALEGHFMSRGLRVVSSAITGRVVASADARGQIEGAAKLPTLERALVLAKGANADCVFYLLELDIGGTDVVRYFVWPSDSKELKEVDRGVYESAPQYRRWFIGGPVWKIGGKVVDVENGSVLSIINLTHSTPFVQKGRVPVRVEI